ncbi:preprotein translocase subunit SecY [Taibaiella sp. KBW10]|uniref:preprotein translocase subunit SecY n=1 Tax=Taibaiella sp. KBW10 TaxID=2153357 RepID=UPI000F5AC40B|nr:preprotein translocase subunit SecY [Taibaiella sp. KBW10]RQO31899.1 preprotein translocase subunit SecY [Taibaiella sp. KBW10]
MKKFIEKIKDVWGIEELRNRILLTLGLILVYRLGTFIVLPGINPNALNQNQNQDGLLGLINMFAGGAFSNAAILALGVMPYISASIFMQLAGIVIPQFAKLQKEESGRNKINQYTRILTIIVAAFQGSAYIGTYLKPIPGAIVSDTMLFYVSTVVILTAGTLFVMWLGEKITDKGIGNGVSILIMVGILARFPHAVVQEFSTKISQDKVLFLLIELAMFIAVLIGLVLLTQGVRKIPLNYARRIVGTNAAKEIGGSRNFIPLKVNSAGVMPIIFAQALLFIPAMLAGVVSQDGSAAGWLRAVSDHTSLWYNLIYAFLVIVFTYFYTALIFNPTEMAENLKRNNSFIPGIQPGQPTADYIGAIMDRITLPGAVFLALAGILPGIAALLGVTSGFSSFFGGTSMLIGVAVILDTIQQIDSYLLMRQYDGMMKTGRVSGRQAVQL